MKKIFIASLFVSTSVMATSYFTFSNEGATHLLIPVEKSIPKASELKEGVCTNGQKITLKYESFKSASKKNSGRQTSFNFSDHGGEYYKITGGKIASDDSCFIGDSTFFVLRKPVKLTIKKEDCSLKERERIGHLKKRKVQWCFKVSELETGGHLFFSQFVKSGTNDLAVVGFISQEKLLLKDYPTDISDWRVDEENDGKFPYESIKIFFPYQTPDKRIGFVTEWPGAEGNSLEVLEETGTELKAKEAEYFYWAPI